MVAGALDYEAANSHDVIVLVMDFAGNTYVETLTIDVTDVNESPAIALANTVTSIDENTSVGGGIKVADIVVTDDALGAETLTLSGDDAGSFAIVGSELHYVGSAPDFEAQSSYSVTVNANDESLGDFGSVEASQDFTLTINDVNEAPADIALSNSSIAENSANGAVVGALSSLDPEAGDSATFTLVDDAGGRFAISGSDLVVAGALDYESATSHQVTVQVTDSADNTYEKTFTIAVSDVAGALIVGDNNSNTLVGTPEDDTIQGLGGDDLLTGAGGDDDIDGGAGFDRSIYTDATGAITVNLAAGTVSGDGIGTDTLQSIERIRASDFADSFNALGFGGSSANAGSNGTLNEFEGMAGDDIITGNGNTRVNYQLAAAAVTVDLVAGTGIGDASVGTDHFTGVNSARGSVLDDTLLGNAFNNIFEGRSGNDLIDGRGGIDRAIYIFDTEITSGITVMLASGVVTGDQNLGTDTLRSIEGVTGTMFADVFDATGFSGASTNVSSNGEFNDFEGRGGDDVIIGNSSTFIAYSSATAGVTVDLLVGSAVGDASVGTDNLSGIRGVTGSNFNDTLRGSDNITSFISESFTPLAGDDFIDGRGGGDSIRYDDGRVTSGINVQLAAGTITGGPSIGTDTLRSIESVFGTAFDDVFDATGFSDSSLNAGSIGVGGVFNQFLPGNGNDTITGNGDTQLFYSNLTAGINLDFFTGTVTGATAGTDTFSGVRYVGATNFDDTIIGDDNFQQVQGLAGNDTIYGHGGFDELLGLDGNDTLEGGEGPDNLDGGAGNDTLSYAGSPAGVTVNLDTHTASGGDAEGDNLLAANFQNPGGIQTFENIRGSEFDDHLTGNGGDNIITGGAGSDTLAGAAGLDNLDGGGGDDTFVFSPGSEVDVIAGFVAGVGTEDRIDLTAMPGIYSLADLIATQDGPDTVLDFGGGDSIILENILVEDLHEDDFVFAEPTGGALIVGDNNSNTLVGTPGDDTIQGLGGDDLLTGAGGDDDIDGGAGFDRSIYTDATGAITVNLAAGTVSGDGIGTDTLHSIERIRASDFADTFNALGFSGGSANAGSNGTLNEFEGMAGDDTITGNGNTRVSYQLATDAVLVDLAAGTGTGDASVGTDHFTGVNAVRGSVFDDTLLGNAFNNVFEGRAGDDLISGAGGTDRAQFNFDTEITAGIDIMLASGVVTGDESLGTDTLQSIEAVTGTSFADVFDATGFSGLSMNAGSNGTFNQFEGRGGDDTIIGNGNTIAAYFSATAPVTVDLVAGTAFADDGSVGIDTLIGITRIAGSNFGDTLHGNGASNIIVGLGGNDLIDGGANTGGGSGVGDRADYRDATAGINVQLADGIVTGNSSVGTDTLRSMEGVIGSNFADVYDATGFDSASLNASSVAFHNFAPNGEFNQVEGLGGNDLITGNGFTELNFFSATGGVSVDLTTGIATGNISVGTDTFTGVNAVNASAFDDTIIGDDNANVLEGRDRDDEITGGGGDDIILGDGPTTPLHGNDVLTGGTGNDQLFGGGGDDTFVFAEGDGADVIGSFTGGFVAGAGTDDRIDLTGVSSVSTFADVLAIASDDGFGNTVIDFGGGDSIWIESVQVGDLHEDDFIFAEPIVGALIVGDNNSNTLVGTPGDDTIQGLGGDDLLTGAGGDDLIEGGTGLDRAIYTDAAGAVTVDLAAGTATGAGVGTDTLQSVEAIRGSDFADSYVASGFGSSSPNAGSSGTFNSFEGMGGDDSIIGSDTRISYVSSTGSVTVDLAAGTAFATAIERVSVANTGTQGDSESREPSISGDGRYVAFESHSSNLLAADNGYGDIFVFDRATNTIERISVGDGGVESNGDSTVPAISADGRYVAFVSAATNLVADDTNGLEDIFVYDRDTDSIERVSVGAGGVEGNDNVFAPAINADGRYVAFHSRASNLVADDTNGNEDIFVYDRDTDTIERVSVGAGDVEGNSHSVSPSISADGRYVVFNSDASNLVANDTNGQTDIFVYDRDTDTIERVSIGTGSVEANGSSFTPAISADGRYVVFVSGASNLVADDTNGNDDIFVYDRDTDTIERVSVGASGVEGDSGSDAVTISGDGRYVAFRSAASNIVADDTNGFEDIFVYDRDTDTIERVSNRSSGVESNGDAGDIFSISADGTYVALASNASNLVTNDTNGEEDIFVTNRTVFLDESIGVDTFTGVRGVHASAFDDTLFGSNTTSTIEQFFGGGGDDLIDGRGGLDMALYFTGLDNNVTGGVTINMAAGNVTGDISVGTDTLRSVEFVRGSSFADIYNATNFGAAGFLNPAVNNVGSNGTFNEIEGMGGSDTITGNGNTRIAFYNATGGVTVDLAAGTAAGDSSVGSDTITGGVSAIAGSQFVDTLFGGGSAPTEMFDGRAGNDSFDGRGGFDQAIYNNDGTVTAGITVDMAAGSVTGDAAVGTDTLQAIKSVRGTNFADSYVATGFGSGANIGSLGSLNEFEGMGGDDVITGSGDTRISYVSANGGVTVDLAAGTATGNASVGSDTITGGVARVRGSNNSDTISGDSGNNILEGQNGADRLDGRGGNDLLNGGGGADTFVFTSNLAAGGTVTDFIGNGPAAGDKMEFFGFGAVEDGATFTFLEAGQWQIHSGLDGHDEIITLTGSTAASVDATDYLFLV